ncbi:myeloid-associated differentiation marker-like protein 2 [Xenentodon cancila]
MSPRGVWCEFVWVFCVIVPLGLIMVEASKWHILLTAFLPNWATTGRAVDWPCCGLAMLCTAMITSATIIFVVVFVSFFCIIDINVFIFLLAATVIFLIDAAMQKKNYPGRYLTSLRGILRLTEAFIDCIILTAATDHFVTGEWSFKAFGEISSQIGVNTFSSTTIFAVCLPVTMVTIILHLLKLLQSLFPFRLNGPEFVFNMAAVLLYLHALILWLVFSYKRSHYNPYSCNNCSFADLNTVTVGCIVNLILYIVDLVSSKGAL